jgi:formylglycine-generating enzyme required for sulfatase activity
MVKLLGDARLPAVERALAGRTLAILGDPRPEVMTVDGMEFRIVAAGRFWMGSGEEDSVAYDDEKPRHEVDLPYEYRMARYPVTVAQFREYVEATGVEPGEPGSLRGPANRPVVEVSWFEAVAFCEWLTGRLREKGCLKEGWAARLPSEAEWEKAARGTEGRIYPWGPEFDPERANTHESGIGGVSTVGCFPNGASVYGCEEMSGNVLEWTRSLWGEDSPLFSYPYEPLDGRENLKAPARVVRILRGGLYCWASRFAQCAVRLRPGPYFRLGKVAVGFRVLLSPSSSGL